MLQLTITTERTEMFDEATQRFFYGEPTVIGVIEMEHSLASLSKWESKHQVPFLDNDKLTPEQMLDYLKCMVLPESDPELIMQCSQANLDEIREYINSGESATTFGRVPERAGRPRERITSELIYYWMASFRIPVEAEHWHLGRLLALIKIFSVKNTPPSKRSAREIMEERARINAERRAAYNTSG